MKKILFLLLGCLFLASCGSSKKRKAAKKQRTYQRNITKAEYGGKWSEVPETKVDSPGKKNKNTPKLKSTDIATRITEYAKGFLGTKYRYGGTTKQGMDCSGLVYQSFLNAADIFLPRSSREMAKQGKRIRRNEIRKGDLVFFKTNPRSNVINHIGIVIENNKGDIDFIHSSTSKGVMISGLDDMYWNKVFVQARRVL